MASAKEHVSTICQKLAEQSKQYIGGIGKTEFVRANGYKTDNTFPESGWQKMPDDHRFQGNDAHFWIRGGFQTPPQSEGKYLVLSATTGKEGQWDATNPQGLLYLNGEMVQGFDTNHTEAFLDYDTDYTMHLYFYMGLTEEALGVKLALYEIDRRIEQLYYDIKVPLDSCSLLKNDSGDYIKTMSVLERCVNLLDMRNIYSDEYFKSIEAAEQFIQEELYGKLCSTEGKPIVNCIGHTHIDVEWQWTRFQTKEKIQRSFATAASLMKRYPEYKFMLSQPELYRYLKEEAPEKYEELKALVRDGRWEPEGAMYLEADCNLISGESFVRQILHGKRFFKDEFGVDCKILFLPDVFGYSAAMPQILKKSGIRHFVTSKISWNDTNTMPVDTFLWEGIDGSEIFSNFITAQDYTEKPSNFTTYVGMLNPSEIRGTWHRYLQKEYCNRALTTVGYGDGGGGPTAKMLEQYRRMAKGLPGMPVAEMDFLLPHLDRARAEFDESCKKNQKTPKWVGELYLEFHRGTYTSIGKNKRNNRKSEFMLTKAEALSMIDAIYGGDYDAAGLHDNWRLVLHNQFHDIIPGSSIHEVYELTDADYAQVRAYCDGVAEQKLAALAARLNTKGGVMVYNPLGFAQGGAVKLNGKTAEIREKLPALGWSVLPALDHTCDVKIDGLTAENKYYKLTLDETGAIASLYDKRADREVFLSGKRGNELQVFEDFPCNWDNWELSDYYKQKMWLIDEKAEIVPIFDGSRAGFSVTKKYQHSLLKQNIWLYSELARIDFEHDVDWHEQHQLLKVAFPLDIHTMSATYEIQYGHVTRPTHENTSWDKAKFEVYGHKWVDLSENGYGVALLNDCKYGHNTEGSTVKLTLLKCGTFPDPEADQGRHVFTYSLLPHLNDLYTAGVIQEAYALNQPLCALEAPAADGTLPEQYSLVSVDRENVIVEAVKKAEDDDGMIVRMYDAYDRRTKATVTVSGDFKNAYLCDLMENVLEPLAFDGHTVTLPISNFEIVTLKFTK